MRIHDITEKSGNWFFRQRSYLPSLIIPILLLALLNSEYIEKHFGDTAQAIWEVFCISVSFLGLIVRSLTVAWVPEGTSGRNRQGQLAESLNTEGLYSVMRHPLYLANFLIILGFVLFVQVWWFVLIYMLLFCLFYERIIFAEESFLERKFGDAHRQWAEKTPIFFPDFRRWRHPAATFSWKMILKREYSTFFGIIVGFVLIKFFAELFGERQFKVRVLWLVFLGIGFVVYWTLRILRTKTQWLTIQPKDN
ncbi:MAG TPA: isoprenylcysteine carboxylmethyltransferase family protein [Candidatus Omnitrophota bacterium]|nr:isoprenylcysteine carboxylmethyltransferase family protein [Candidatus Omnitrophota bacterium]